MFSDTDAMASGRKFSFGSNGKVLSAGRGCNNTF